MPNTRNANAENARRLAKLALDGNRRLLACLPIEPNHNEPCLARQAKDGRRAMRLKGDSRANLLTRALADDPHFGPYMAIPGKDNGFDIEGLAVDGHRLLLGLRGPVLRGWSALRGGKASWLVLYDAPGADRKQGEHTVFGDLLRHD
jgi:hypothetical protein